MAELTTEPDARTHKTHVFRKALFASFGAVVVIALALAIWQIRFALLLVFAGILLAVLLHGLSAWIERKSGMPRLAALPLILIFIGLLIGITVMQAGPTFEEQIRQLFVALQKVAASIAAAVREATAEQEILQQFNLQELLKYLPSPWGVASGATAVLGAVLGTVAAAFIVLFFGIYLAADPATYVRLAVRLAPEGQAGRARDLLVETGSALRAWLVGQFAAMAVIGILVYLGLLILGLPLAFVLALFAAFMGFIPYLGPILGAIPMLAVAGGQGLDVFLYVFALYLTVQAAESYLLTPMIQSRAIHMPPAIVIASQLVFGALFGIIGLALATPLVAAAAVPLSHLYPPRPVNVPTT